MLFVQLAKQQWHSILKNVALLKENDFVIATKIISEYIHGYYIQKVKKSFIANTVLCFSTSLVNCGVGKNREKPGNLVIEPLCSFNKLTGSDGYLYEHDKLKYHKSMTIIVIW